MCLIFYNVILEKVILKRFECTEWTGGCRSVHTLQHLGVTHVLCLCPSDLEVAHVGDFPDLFTYKNLAVTTIFLLLFLSLSLSLRSLSANDLIPSFMTLPAPRVHLKAAILVHY